MLATIRLFSSIHLEFLGVVVHDPPSPSIIELKRCKSSKEEEKQQSVICWWYLARQHSQRGRALTYVRRQVLLRWHNGALRREYELERWPLWQLSWQSCNLWSQQWSGPFWARLSFWLRVRFQSCNFCRFCEVCHPSVIWVASSPVRSLVIRHMSSLVPMVARNNRDQTLTKLLIQPDQSLSSGGVY